MAFPVLLLHQQHQLALGNSTWTRARAVVMMYFGTTELGVPDDALIWHPYKAASTLVFQKLAY